MTNNKKMIDYFILTKITMEFTGYHMQCDRSSETINFAKKGNLIYIEMPNVSGIANSCTVLFKNLQFSPKLYGYYLLSVSLTPSPTNITLFDISPIKLWNVETIICWDKNYYDRYYCCSFDKDPADWTLELSSFKEIADFFTIFWNNFKSNPYSILNSFIDWELDCIDNELSIDEKYIDRVDYQIKGAANLMAGFSLPCDIALLCI
jgi:hypothetical protein